MWLMYDFEDWKLIWKLLNLKNYLKFSAVQLCLSLFFIYSVSFTPVFLYKYWLCKMFFRLLLVCGVISLSIFSGLSRGNFLRWCIWMRWTNNVNSFVQIRGHKGLASFPNRGLREVPRSPRGLEGTWWGTWWGLRVIWRHNCWTLCSYWLKWKVALYAWLNCVFVNQSVFEVKFYINIDTFVCHFICIAASFQSKSIILK